MITDTHVLSSLIVFSLFFFWHPMHGIWGSRARGQIWAAFVAYVIAGNNAGSFNPLCQAGNQTCVLVLQRLCQSCCIRVRTANIGVFFFCLFLIFDHPMPYGVPGPEVRSEMQLPPKLQLQQYQILNPMSWAGNWTWVPVLPRCHWTHWTTAGTPLIVFYGTKYICSQDPNTCSPLHVILEPNFKMLLFIVDCSGLGL